MNNSTPADALLGNRLFNFDATPELVQSMQQDLATAQEEAKDYAGVNQEGNWHYAGPDGSIDSVTAGHTYQLIRLFVEDDVLNLAKRHSPAAWLWYLRKLPLFFFDFEGSRASAYGTSDVAEIMTALAQKDAPSEPESLEPLRYKMDWNVTLDLLRLCGKIHVLRKIHQRIRTAGKEVDFKHVPGDLPVPAPTESQREAMRRYDQRSSKHSLPSRLATRTGTLLMEPGSDLDAIVVPVKDFAGTVSLPNQGFDDYAEQTCS